MQSRVATLLGKSEGSGHSSVHVHMDVRTFNNYGNGEI